MDDSTLFAAALQLFAIIGVGTVGLLVCEFVWRRAIRPVYQMVRQTPTIARLQRELDVANSAVVCHEKRLAKKERVISDLRKTVEEATETCSRWSEMYHATPEPESTPVDNNGGQKLTRGQRRRRAAQAAKAKAIANDTGVDDGTSDQTARQRFANVANAD